MNEEFEKYYAKQDAARLTEKCFICGHILAHGHIYEIDGKWCHRVCWLQNQPKEQNTKPL